MKTHRFLRMKRQDVTYIPFLLVLLAVLGGLLARNHHLATRESWAPVFARAGVWETVLVFVGSSTCGGSRYPGLDKALRAIRTGLRAEAFSRGETFASIGISTDMVIDEGTKYLKRMGLFDEIMAGRSWMNSGSLKCLYGVDLGGHVAIPQILVIERLVEHPERGPLMVTGERTRFRKAGGDEIVRWSRLTYPEFFVQQ